MKNYLVLIWSLSIIHFSEVQGQCNGGRTANINREVDTFSIDFFRKIIQQKPSEELKNIVMSGLSVYFLLIQAYVMALGETKRQLRAALGGVGKSQAYYGGRSITQSLQGDRGAVIKKLDKVYIDDSIPFRCNLSVLTEVELLNLGNSETAARKINNEVSKTTNGKINDLVSARNLQNAKFVLLNALYFKGDWEHPFNTRSTTSKPFFNEEKKEIGTVQMMKNTLDLKTTFSRQLRAQVLELPYAGSNVSMILILPRKGITLKSVLENLTSDKLNGAVESLETRRVRVWIPKWEIKTELDEELKKALQALEIEDIFVPKAADLSLCGIPRGTSVSTIKQQCVLEVTEKGTEAAAATFAFGTRMLQNTIGFIADRPFVYLIRDRSTSTGVTLFAGVFNKP